jgi:hypothetical protein
VLRYAGCRAGEERREKWEEGRGKREKGRGEVQTIFSAYVLCVCVFRGGCISLSALRRDALSNGDIE